MATTNDPPGDSVLGSSDTGVPGGIAENQVAESIAETSQAGDGDATGTNELAREETTGTSSFEENENKEKDKSDAGPRYTIREGDKERVFTLFRKLAPELQLRIWKLAPVAARYIEVCIAHHDQKQWQILSADHAPALFFTCRDARAEVIKRSTLLRGTGPGAAATYYDPSTDVLVFRYPYDDYYQHWFEFTPWLDSLPLAVVKSIRYMIWEADKPEEFWWKEDEGFDHNYYAVSADYYLKQASINKLCSLEMLGIAHFRKERRKAIMDFVGCEQRHSDEVNELSRGQIRFEMVRSGQAWDHEFEAPKPDWIQPHYKLGTFVLED
ncbi:hypothetical protein N431DRAFT_477132 [Stipitochalara longipes BDJ]|nr:hypothetical protein N431DRAFT_477132 [Stipitochalara longipes BDJ]